MVCRDMQCSDMLWYACDVPDATYAEGNLSGGFSRSTICTLSCSSRRLATARYASIDSTILNSLPALDFVDSTTYALFSHEVGRVG